MPVSEDPSENDYRTRRELARLGAVGGLALSAVGAAEAAPRFRAIAFDAFPVLNPQPVFALANELFPGRGKELSNAWRNRQFEYTWLRTLTGRYTNFWQVTDEALTYAAKAGGVVLSAEHRARLMAEYLALRSWPDVPEAIRLLRDAGVRLAFLSNMTEKMLRSGIDNSGLGGAFEHVLSTDRVNAYKPDRRAYAMATKAFQLPPAQILFAAFAGWDVAGAKAFGYPTFWVNRNDQIPEELGLVADRTGTNLTQLSEFVLGR